MITFQRLTVDDLPLLYRWLTTDPVITHVWSHDQDKSFAEVAGHYTPYITGAKPTDPYLILYGEIPIGYVQTYRWHDYPDYDQYVDMTDAASFDVFIGEKSYRGRGLGPTILTRFLREFVFANPAVTSCVITPEMSNMSAIRASEKVGRRGLDPLWITEVTNHGSRAIADQIGLRLHAEYLLFDRD